MVVEKILDIAAVFILFFGSLIVLFIISYNRYRNILLSVNEIPKHFDKNNFSCKEINKLYMIFKRLNDIITSIVVLVVFSPLFLVIAILIKLDSEGPIFIKLKRCTLKGKQFDAIKFRTMVYSDNKSSNDKNIRITKVGRFLRKTALDELPEFINVFIGHMSVVGTTVAREFDYENISDYHRNCLSHIKPGFTNLWVVSLDRQNWKYENRLAYDLYYLNNISFGLDFYIIIRTIITTMGITASY